MCGNLGNLADDKMWTINVWSKINFRISSLWEEQEKGPWAEIRYRWITPQRETMSPCSDMGGRCSSVGTKPTGLTSVSHIGMWKTL